MEEKTLIVQVTLGMMITNTKFEGRNLTPPELFWMWANMKEFAEKEMDKMLNTKGNVN